jgi:hypothetical protein
MIPRLYVQGILVALLPTDEGCLGQHPKYPKAVKNSGEYYWVSSSLKRTPTCKVESQT